MLGLPYLKKQNSGQCMTKSLRETINALPHFVTSKFDLYNCQRYTQEVSILNSFIFVNKKSKVLFTV